MFMGEYNHTIDAKGRLIVPSKFREQLGDEFVVTKGLDGCLFVYDNTEWKKFEEKLIPQNSPVFFSQLPPLFNSIVRDESCFLRFCGILQDSRRRLFWSASEAGSRSGTRRPGRRRMSMMTWKRLQKIWKALAYDI